MMQLDHPFDDEVKMLVPDDDVAHPQLSLVVPAMNEEITIAEFVAWCHEGLRQAGVVGEIVIVDSSTDKTPEIAVAAGARVLRTPRRGLGRAYIDAIPMIRGEWIIMGDADCTYDFRKLEPFTDGFAAGYEYVMGSRWKGSIEKGAMPWLHQRVGTPVTTWILNRLYDSKFSDIHCGMRGITRSALEQMGLSSQSWEYASELVLKSVHMGLRTTEVPVTFLKDQEGRLSHHRREGWFSPFKAAWINLKAMFIYGADFFLVKPGMILLLLGLLLTIPLTLGPITLGPITFSLFWMLFGLSLSVLGLQSLYLGWLAQVFYDYQDRITERRLQTFRYTRAAGSSMIGMIVGFCMTIPFAYYYLTNSLEIHPDVDPFEYVAVTGLLVLMLSFITFTFTLVLHAATQPGVRREGR